MDQKQQYQALITDIIAKEAVILGPQIAILKAKNVANLITDNDGKVIDINGDPAEVLQQLIDEYVELAGQIVKNALGSIFAKYPSIRKIE